MRVSRVVPLALAVVLVAGAVSAQSSFEVVRTFSLPPREPLGRLVEMPDGSLYGTTFRGGVRDVGAIVRYGRRSDGTLDATTVHVFTIADGEGPMGSLVRGADGALYGTTLRGGANGRGTAFRYLPGGSLTLLHSFGPADVGGPGPLTLARDGNFYGPAEGQEDSPIGIFRMTPTGDVTVIARYDPAIGAFDKRLPLIAAPDGHLYGISSATPFRVSLAGNLTVVNTFDWPYETLSTLTLAANGNFYATTYGGHTLPQPAALYRVTAAGVRTRILTFPANQIMQDLIQGADGRLYGAVHDAQFGLLVSITTTGHVTTLHRFSYWDGSAPDALVQIADGAICGTAIGGGQVRRGAVFRLTSTGVATVHAFADPTPLVPAGALTRGPDGSLYGTSCLGGELNSGTVYRLSATNQLTVLHSFAYWDGACPLAGLTVGANGVLYGTAFTGGLFNGGSIFRITSDGDFRVLHFFAVGSGRSASRAVLASDGNLYGTFAATNRAPGGGIYQITQGDIVRIVHQFGTSEGELRWPDGLAEGTDGALYGLTFLGPSPAHRAFRMHLGEHPLVTPFTLLGPNAELRGPMTPAGDGGFYGIASTGAGHRIFKMTATGVFSVLDAPIEGDLLSGPIVGTDGNIYGASAARNDSELNAVFRMTPLGDLTVLHGFSTPPGERPWSALLEASPGVFYGTTINTDLTRPGAIFKVTVPAASTNRD